MTVIEYYKFNLSLSFSIRLNLVKFYLYEMRSVSGQFISIHFASYLHINLSVLNVLVKQKLPLDI